MATQSPAFFSWQQPLAAFFGGLSAAGQPGGFANFGAGVNQVQQQQQQAAQQQQLAELRDLQIQQQQDAARRANQEAAQRQAASQNFAAMLGTGAQGGRPAMFSNLSPDVRGLAIQMAQNGDLENAYGLLAQNMKPNGGGASSALGKLAEDYKNGLIDKATYEAAVQRENYIPPQQGVNPKTSLVPFYAQDAQGKWHMYQPTDTGVPLEVKLPEGVNPARPLSFQDLGTSVVGVQPLGGAPQVSMPKDVAGVKQQQTVGEAAGTAQAGLPEAAAKAGQAIDLIESLKTHKGRAQATGLSSVLPLVPGSDAYDFNVKLDQLKGDVFLQAYSQLRGGGAITEIEGTKAEQAIARLNRAQSEEEFTKSLNDLEEVINAGVERMKKKAQGNFSAVPAEPTTIDGYTITPVSQ